MARPPRSLWFALGIVLTSPGAAVFAQLDQLDQLAIRVPSSANALVVVNVKAAYASPLAQAQGWDPSGLKAHQGGMITLPAQAESFLMAAEMDFEFMQPLWEIAVAYVRQMPTMQDIATRSGGRLDRVAGSETWEVNPQGKTIAFEGNLSKSGLRRVLSVLSSPVGPLAASSSSKTSAEDAMAESSQRYFQAVTNYLNDLFLNDRQPASLYQAKLWVERYARKIEDLDDHQVDEEVVGFGQDVIGSLHEIVSVLDRSERRSDLRESTMYDSGRRRYGRYGAYGFFEKSYATRDSQVVQADETGRGIQESQVIVDELRQLSAQTRQSMTERYDLPF